MPYKVRTSFYESGRHYNAGETIDSGVYHSLQDKGFVDIVADTPVVSMPAPAPMQETVSAPDSGAPTDTADTEEEFKEISPEEFLADVRAAVDAGLNKFFQEFEARQLQWEEARNKELGDRFSGLEELLKKASVPSLPDPVAAVTDGKMPL